MSTGAPWRVAPMAADAPVGLTVGITTRNRPDALRRCLASIALIDDLVTEVIIVDDASDQPIDPVLQQVPESIAEKTRIIEMPRRPGYIVGRNRMMRLAANEIVLMLDDDAYLIDAEAVTRACEVLRRHPDVAAVACAMADAGGSPWPAAMQPSPVDYRCYVPSYIGFAALLRRSVFVKLGGYNESFHYNGEEKDYCLRLLDAGYDVVYLPDARVAHVPDPASRSASKYLRYVIRNDCLNALYNEPLPMAVITVPIRLARYPVMRRHAGVDDPGGLRWIVGQLIAAVPAIWRDRRSMRWSSIRRWRHLRRARPAFVS
jgi:GT2 family glycosyltransferase